MCGIAGAYLFNGRVDRERFEGMRDVLTHRGPDGKGLYLSEDGSLALGHRRLVIIDRVGGEQPMTSACGRYVLSYNGEIYNYLELRQELEDYPFRTVSDTEVLLAAFVRWGLDCLPRLNGMFAFSIYDVAARELILARDPLGVKPLYYRRDKDGFLFASEIKAIFAYLNVRGRLNLEGLADYLTFQYFLDDKTLFEGVRAAPPGCCLVVSPGNEPRRHRYFSLRREKRDVGHAEAARECDALLADAVRIQLRSDVALGCHLSGGMDTGLIATYAAGQAAGRLKTFSAAFSEGGVFDDSDHARITATSVGAEHHVVYPSRDEFLEEMPRLIWHMDQPCAGEGLFPQYHVSRLAAGKVGVVLGGQGADELFGGYARHYLFLWLEAMAARMEGRSAADGHDVADLAQNLPYLKGYWPLVRSVTQGAAFPHGARAYLRLIARCPALDRVLAPEVLEALGGYDPRDVFLERYASFPGKTPAIDRVMEFELACWLPALLHVEDRMSMACSMESRVPFLDSRLIAFALGLPGGVALRNGEPKSVVRDLARQRLPFAISSRRDKIGFPVPIRQWDVGPYVATHVDRAGKDFISLFHKEYVDAAQQSGGLGDRRLWGMLCLSLWWNSFIQ